MIDTSAAVATERQELFPSDPRFRLDPPGGGPLIATAPVVFTQVAGDLRVVWDEKDPESMPTDKAKAISEGIVESARRDVTRYPGSPRTHNNLGLALFNCGQLEEASAEFEAALKLKPRDYNSLANLGRVRVLQGRLEEAESVYRLLGMDRPNDPGVLMSLAYIATRRKDFKEAVGILERVCNADPSAAWPRYNLARVLLAEGREREAISSLKAASRSVVRSPEIHYGLGVAYAVEGALERAARSFRAALTLAPGMTEAIHGLARIFLKQKKYQRAIALLSDHLGKNPHDREAHEFQAFAHYEQKEFRLARLQLLKALGVIGESNNEAVLVRARLSNNLGVCAVHLGESKQAEAHFQEAIELRPEASPIPYHNLARLYFERENFQKANAVLESCVAQFPQDQRTRVLLALSLEVVDRPEEAIGDLEQLIKKGKAPATAYAVLGGLLVEEKRDLDAAGELLKRALLLFPGNALVVNNLAYLLLRRGLAKEAREVLASLPSIEAPNVALTATRGLLHLVEGDFKKANQRYREAERVALRADKRQLARVVRQKMHLELARAYARRGEVESAQREVREGLRIEGRKSYHEDLQALEKYLRENPSAGDSVP